MTTQYPVHPGHPTQPMVSLSAQPPTTTDASNSTSHPCNASGSPTRGACIQRTARSWSLHNTISLLLLQQTSSKHLATLYLQRRKKIRHIQAIQNLTAIMTGQRDAPEEPPSPRVVAPTARVVSAPPPRVATTSNNITAPNVTRTMPLVLQRHNHNNNPFNNLANDDDDDDTVVDSNCSPYIPPPSLPPSNLQGNS
jgi:hypothetical protein